MKRIAGLFANKYRNNKVSARALIKVLAFLIFVLSSNNLFASSLNFFPQFIEDCGTGQVSQSCSSLSLARQILAINPANSEEFSQIDVYEYRQSTYDTNTGQVLDEDKMLFKYWLGTASQKKFDPLYSGLEAGESNISGSLWLSINKSYDSNSDDHRFSLFFDQVTPANEEIFSDHSKLDFSITSAGLLQGHGSYFELDSGVQKLELTPNQDYEKVIGLLPCLDITCEVGAAINFMGFDFVDNLEGELEIKLPTTSIFSLEDFNQPIYTQLNSHYGSGKITQIYSIAQVPIPSAGALLCASIISLGFFRRNKSLKA